MKQTNYHLFDFLDFDPNLQADEELWMACRPTQVRADRGGVVFTVPFQKQLKQNDMQADTSVPREEHEVLLRLYSNQTLRLTVRLSDKRLAALTGDLYNDEMLCFAPSIQVLPLQVVETEKDLFVVLDAEGKIYARDRKRPLCGARC